MAAIFAFFRRLEAITYAITIHAITIYTATIGHNCRKPIYRPYYRKATSRYTCPGTCPHAHTLMHVTVRRRASSHEAEGARCVVRLAASPGALRGRGIGGRTLPIGGPKRNEQKKKDVLAGERSGKRSRRTQKGGNSKATRRLIFFSRRALPIRLRAATTQMPKPTNTYQ